MDQVKDILDDKGNTVHYVGPDSSIMDALKVMEAYNIGVVLVIEDDKIRGIFSERDCVQDLVNHQGTSLIAPITEFMTTPVYFVTPEQTLEDCMAVMTTKHIRHLPVLDNEILVGMISIGDVVKKIVSDRDERIKDLENFLWVNLI